MNTRKITISAHIVNIGLLALFFILSVVVYNDLPPQIPAHYNFQGVPDRFTNCTMVTWLTMPIIFTVMTVFLYAIALWIPWFSKHPGLVNMPPKLKERFLALSDENRRLVLRHMAAYFFWMPVAFNLMFLIMRILEHRYIIGRTAVFQGIWALPIMVIGLVLIIVFMIKGTQGAMEKFK